MHEENSTVRHIGLRPLTTGDRLCFDSAVCKVIIAGAVLLVACGDGGGNGGDDDPGDPYSAIFLFNANIRGDTELRGQIANGGAIRLVEPGFTCSNPEEDEPWEFAEFLPAGHEDLVDINDVALEWSGRLVIARYYLDPPYYVLIEERIPYPEAGTEVSFRAEDSRFEATLEIGAAPTVVSPADGSEFRRTEDLPMNIEAPGAAGIIVDMRFSNGARALCFFEHGGNLVFPRKTIAEDTFGVTGDAEVLVGSWTVGEGGTGGVDLHLVSTSTTPLTLTLL